MVQVPAREVGDRWKWQCLQCLRRRTYALRLEAQSCCGFDDAERRGSASVGMCELSYARDRETQPIPCGNADETGGAAVRAVALAHAQDRSAQPHGLTAFRRDSRVPRGIQPAIDVIKEQLQ